MSKLTDTARQYLGVRGQTQAHTNLVNYYNTYVYPLIDNNRKYKMKYTDDWCAMFVSVVAHMNGLKQFPYEVSVYYMTLKARQMGLITSNPKENDLIIYDWNNNGTLDHVGMVTNVSGDTITVIEGNGGNQVIYRTVNRYAPFIECFISVNAPNTSPTQNTTVTGASIDTLVKQTLDGKYGVGEERKRRLGDKYYEVQNRINQMMNDDKIVTDVINGKYGTGSKRKKLLGANYERIQKLVNKKLLKR